MKIAIVILSVVVVALLCILWWIFDKLKDIFK